MPDNPKIIHEVRSGDDIAASLRRGILQGFAELEMSLECADRIAGYADRYLSKVLGPSPSAALTFNLLGALLGAAALKLVFVVDDAQREKILHHKHYSKRKPGPKPGYATAELRLQKRRKKYSSFADPVLGPIARARRMLVTTAKQRTRWARKAAAIRWAAHRHKTAAGNRQGGDDCANAAAR